ncbi:TetR/AcrR family transcriptional regulator [Aeromicrobium sp. CF3.5]|uniref:TetR/AcrR family transcriptional regulator n=1 Tax=Aeromicrobium sp. CF3.5 TaxID=3373078 RepID=UPI003EE4447C
MTAEESPTARAYRGVAAADRQAQRRAKLLDATLDLWGDPARPRVTMTAVCQRAGLTERYFYESFTHLDDALFAVLEQIAVEIEHTTVEALHAAGGDPTDRVEASITAFVQILTEDPRKGRAAIVESAHVETTREPRALLLRRFAELSASEARRLYGARSWGEAEGVLVATMFVGGVAQLVTSWLDGSLSATPEEIVEAAARNFTLTAHPRTGQSDVRSGD